MNVQAVPVTIYWRPGCVYCVRLRRGIRRAGVVTHEINIREDLASAAVVRSLAWGNETVPTVTVGATSMVNPSVREVMAEIKTQSSDQVTPEEFRVAPRFARWRKNRD